MNKTLNINLAGFIFHVDEDAFLRLEKYLTTLKSQFARTEGGKEIVSDIEMRIAELFKERTGEQKQVINLADVEQVIEIMGQPEDYLDLGDEPPHSAPQVEFTSRKKRIFRDPDNRIVGGVAAGVAAYFNTDTIWIRLVFLLLLFFSGFGLLVYIIMWAIIPKAQTTAEKLQMRGEKVNISNIEKAIRDEMQGINENVKGFGNRMSSYDYKRSSNQLSSFFSDLGNFIVDAIKLIFRIVGKLIGLFFLFLGFMILIALVIGLFAGGVEIMGSGYGFSDMFEFFHLVTVSEGHYNLLLAGIILSVIAPFFLLVYLGIRLLFNLEPLNKPTKNALTLTTFLGLVFLVISGVKIGLQYDNHAEVSKELTLGSAKNYVLSVKPDSLYQEFRRGDAPGWLHNGNIHAFNQVDVDVRQAEGDKPYIKIYSSAAGNDRKAARFNAREIRFELELRDSTIFIPSYYILNSDQKFRDQEVEVVLFLPEGHSVFIEENLVEMLDDVENLQNTWDFEMGNTRWIMTPDGLSCEGCPIPEPDSEEEYKYEYNSNDSNNSLELKIDEDGVKFKIDEKTKKGEHIDVRISSHTGADFGPVHTGLLPFNNQLWTII